eukprot:evm.model.NODE_29543_length_8038_cov_16.965664.2
MELEAQLASVPSADVAETAADTAAAAATGLDGEKSKGSDDEEEEEKDIEEDEDEDEVGPSSCEEEEDAEEAGDAALWEDEDGSVGGVRRVRVLVRVVEPPLWMKEERARGGERKSPFPSTALVHVTVVADAEDSGEGEEEGRLGGGGKRRSRRVKLQSQRPLGLEINGGEKRVLLKGERRKVHAKDAEAAVTVQLGGNVDVQLLLPSSSSSPSGEELQSQQPLSLSALLKDAKEWRRLARRAPLSSAFSSSSSSSSSSSAFPFSSSSSSPSLHTYQTNQTTAFYSWLASLDTVAWEEGNVALSPEIQEEEREGGKVFVAHLVFPVATGALYVGGYQIRHPAFLRRHKAAVVAENEIMMLR